MIALTRLHHTFRLCRSPHLVLVLGVAVLVTVGFTQLSADRVHLLLETGAPLLAMAAAGHVLVVDEDEGFAEVLQTYPAGRLRLGVERLFVAGVFVLVLAVPLVEVAWWSTSLDRYAAWQAFLPPTLVLVGIAMLIGTLTANWVWGLAGGSVYWLLEMGTMGRISGRFFLFQASMPRIPIALATSRWLLVALGITLVLGSLASYVFRERVR